MDLFDVTHDDIDQTNEEALGIQMRAQWDADQRIVRERRVIPDWIGEPSPLSQDKARLLNVLYECGCVAWSSTPCKGNRDVTNAIGLESTANAKAVIDECNKLGLVSARHYRGQMIFEMTMDGEFALDEYQQEKELGF